MSKKNRTFNLFDFENDAVDFNSVPEEETSNEEFFSIVNIFAQEADKNLSEDPEDDNDEDAAFSGAQLSMFGNETTEEFFIENVTVDEEKDEEYSDEDITPVECDVFSQEDTKYVPSEFETEEITESIPDTAQEKVAEEIIEETAEEVAEEIIEETAEEVAEEISDETNVFEVSYVNADEEVPVEEATVDEAEEVISLQDVTFEEVDYALDAKVYEAVKELENNTLDQEAEFTVSTIDTDAFANLTKFEDIKNVAVLEAFETPYVFNGKNGPRIRYRLSLPTKRNAKKARALKSILSWSLTITLAVFIALVLRMFVFVIATVDGPSMMPTLNSGEKLFVSKCAYYFSDVQRGDVIICEYNTAGYNEMYVKRVIGVGGDRIRVTDGVLYVNDEVVEENYIKAPGSDIDEYIVPIGSIYVLGDNRRNSTDSEELGPIKEELVIGKVVFRIAPFTMMEAKS